MSRPKGVVKAIGWVGFVASTIAAPFAFFASEPWFFGVLGVGAVCLLMTGVP